MGGGRSRGTLESQNHLLLAGKETEAGEVIKLPRVASLARLKSRVWTPHTVFLNPSPVVKSPLWKELTRSPKKSRGLAGMMVALLRSRWPGNYRADA